MIHAKTLIEFLNWLKENTSGSPIEMRDVNNQVISDQKIRVLVAAFNNRPAKKTEK